MSNELGIDRSGNGNNWTVNNITIADQVVDSPTNNFATLNPLRSGANDISEGNLKVSGSSGNNLSTMTITGKRYFEFAVLNVNGTGSQFGIGSIFNPSSERRAYGANGQLYNGTNWVNYGDSYAAGDIIAAAVDPDNNTIEFYKNNVSQGSYSITSGAEYMHYNFTNVANFGVVNFGQDSSFAGNKTAQGNQDGNDIGDFYYTPPTGFLALCTKNLPNVAVTPSEHFNTVLYNGTGSAVSVRNVGFRPDFIWGKKRNAVQNHWIIDAVRGAGKNLFPDNTDSEGTEANGWAFDNAGFDTNTNSLFTDNGGNYVAWNWKANGSGSSNTNGTITSTVSANVDAGFSIVGYTGNQTAGATVGHGLSKAPEMIITKSRAGTTGWLVGHNSLPNWSYGLALNTTAATWSENPLWNSTAPDATKFTLGSDTFGNSSNTRIAYCFHSVDGYSKVGSYIGNDNADGTFVYTGFRVAFLLIKNTAVAGEGFVIINNKSDPNNPTGTYLEVFGSSAEQGTAGTTFSRSIDFLSNGFKLRGNSTEVNDGETMVYYAIAETPFKYSNAR